VAVSVFVPFLVTIRVNIHAVLVLPKRLLSDPFGTLRCRRISEEVNGRVQYFKKGGDEPIKR